MENQVLNIEQMKRLKELGVDTSSASMKLVSVYPSSDCDENTKYVAVDKSFHSKMYNERGFALNLQDILELLPKKIKGDKHDEYFMYIDCDDDSWGIYYSNQDEDGSSELAFEWAESLLDAAYDMLCWCKINNKL